MNFIINPKTNKKYSIYSNEGSNILRKYLDHLKIKTGGRLKCKGLKKTKPPKCNDQPHCKWVIRKGCKDKVNKSVVVVEKKLQVKKSVVVNKRLKCKGLKKTKAPKCNDQPNCKWVKGKGCKDKVNTPVDVVKKSAVSDIELKNLYKLMKTKRKFDVAKYTTDANLNKNLRKGILDFVVKDKKKQKNCLCLKKPNDGCSKSVCNSTTPLCKQAYDPNDFKNISVEQMIEILLYRIKNEATLEIECDKKTNNTINNKKCDNIIYKSSKGKSNITEKVLLELLLQLNINCGGGIGYWYAKTSISQVDYILISRDSKTNTICGFVLIKEEKEYLYIDVICSGHGLGSKMLQSVEHFSLSLGKKYIRLSSVWNARSWYLKKGFNYNKPGENICDHKSVEMQESSDDDLYNMTKCLIKKT